MKKLILLFSLLLASCSSSLIEVEACNSRTGKVTIEVADHLQLRQIGTKLIAESFFPKMGKCIYSFRPGKKSLVIFFRDSFDSELVGLDTYESPAFELSADFIKGSHWKVDAPRPQSLEEAQKIYNAEQVPLNLIDEQGKKLAFKRIL